MFAQNDLTVASLYNTKCNEAQKTILKNGNNNDNILKTFYFHYDDDVSDSILLQFGNSIRKMF